MYGCPRLSAHFWTCYTSVIVRTVGPEVASYPGREGEGEKRPGTYCTRMRQHFRDICRKIVRITLSKHVVMLR